MRKQLKVLLVVCLVLSLVSQIKPFAAVSYDDSFNVSGYTMSEDYFKAAYGSNPADRKEILATKGGETKTATDARISNIEIKNSVISLSISMGTVGKDVSISGEMYASARTQYGVNSIVVDAECSDTDYTVLLFEIWNDNDVDNQVLYNTSVKNTPHVKVYLQSTNSEISMYEFALPASLNDLDASNYEKANKTIDLLWPLKVIESTVTEVSTDEAILREMGLNTLSREANTWSTWINSRTYVNTFYIGEYTYTSYSLPYVDYRYTNVISQDTTWVASFKVSEHLNVSSPYEDDQKYHGNNAYDYTNVRLVFGCGDNSTFVRTYQEGRMRENESLLDWLDGITVFALQKVVSSHPVGATALDVIEFINTVTSTSRVVTLGTENTQMLNSKTVAVGEELGEDYWFEACTNQNGVSNVGHYFTFQAEIQYENAGGNTNTVGVLAIEFDVVEHNEGYWKTRSDEIEFAYTAST